MTTAEEILDLLNASGDSRSVTGKALTDAGLNIPFNYSPNDTVKHGLHPICYANGGHKTDERFYLFEDGSRIDTGTSFNSPWKA